MPARADIQCRNCQAPLGSGQQYCGSCGQKRIAARLTLHEISHDLMHALLHVDRSVLSLIRMLLLHPGAVALDYVQGRRKRYFGPFAFLFVVVAAASALVAISGFHAIVSNRANPMADFLQTHTNLVLLADVPLLAGWMRLLNAHGRFNFAEYLVLTAYASGMSSLFFAVIVIPVWWLLRPDASTALHLFYVYLPIWLVYFGFAAAGFLRGNRARSWCTGVAAAVLSWLATQLIASLAASLIALFVRIG